MGRRSLLAQGLSASRPVMPDPLEAPALVAFDFDGTLTVEDSFTAFLKWRAGPLRWAFGCVRLTPAAIGYLFHRNRGRMKSAAIREFLKGVKREKLEAQARTFAEQAAPRLFRPDALMTWRRWRTNGATTIIVSASPDLIIAPFARGLGCDRLIASAIAFDKDDRVIGILAGPNCRGPEKVRRLREAYGEDMHLTAAYGDTSGDREMLRIADEKGYRVFKGRP
ncbi:MAG: HAD-IB family hydrolase [Caulobacter sp.]